MSFFRASSSSRVRYHCLSWRISTRALALRPSPLRQAATKRRPRRSQTKSLSNHRASACALPGAINRLATRTSTRSLRRAPSVRSTLVALSSVACRPRSLHIFCATSIPPQSQAADGTDIIALWFRRPISVQKSRQLLDIEVLTQNILASQIDDRAMLGFALLVTIGFNQADVFVLDAVAAGGSDHAQEHGLPFVPAFCTRC